MLEKCSIRKSSTFLLNNYYDTPKTSLLIFHFDPFLFHCTGVRMHKARIQHIDLSGKDLYVVDDFFSSSEAEQVRVFSRGASFSVHSYGSREAIEKGEKPARSMSGRERWNFFSNPPIAVHELYKWFATLSDAMEAEVTTLPWDLCAQDTNTSSVVGNFLEEVTYESMEFGKHHDSNPETGISFGIPILYSKEKNFYGETFMNGEKGKPWIISVMLYAAEDNFLPEYRMGTVFYDEKSKCSVFSKCFNTRLVLFEGDILHSIERSDIPAFLKTWRISYVFKLVINPRKENASMKELFRDFMGQYSPKKKIVQETTRI